MKTVPLTNSDLLTIVDDDAYEFLLALGPWKLTDYGYVILAMNWRWGRHTMHRLVLEFNGIDLNGKTPDHIDRIRHHNTLSNLRASTKRGQSMNQRKRSGTSSRFVGVHFDKSRGKWRARARDADGHKHEIGQFDCETEAAKARDVFVLTLPDSEFAVLNFPTGKPLRQARQFNQSR